MIVTVITPTYNRAEFLAETIESVLNQDYPAIEYLVLDDGSTDHTQTVITPYKDRLTFLQHPNMGESRTVNKGYELAKGEIILVVNSDDPLRDSKAISKAMAYFQNDPEVMMVYPDWVVINEKGEVLNERRLPLYTIENMLMSFNVSLGPGLFIRKAVFKDSYYRDNRLKYTGDLDISFRIIAGGNKVVHIPELLASHRSHPDCESVKSKSDLMAREVYRLCTECFKNSNQLPEVCIREKKAIFVLAAYSAYAVCGDKVTVNLKWLLRILRYTDLPFWHRYFKKKLSIPVYYLKCYLKKMLFTEKT